MAKILTLLLLIVFLSQNIEAIEEVSLDSERNPVKIFGRKVTTRVVRSMDAPSCSSGSFVNDSITLTGKERSVVCLCQPQNNKSLTWFDGSCQFIPSNQQSLTVEKLNTNSSIFYCTNNFNCSYRVTVSEQVVITGMSRALQGFIMFLLVVCIVGLGVCMYKNCRYQIYLGCRDSCAPSNSHDGKEFDAYISMGKSVSDIKFVEKHFVDFLQMKHNYKLFLDEDNLLPRLDYSEKVQTKMHLCRRLIIVLTPAYMTNEWCMYCFSEGLRKILELGIDLIFIVTDMSIQREISSLSSVVGHVPKLFFSALPMMQTKSERNQILQKLRLLMPPSPHGSSYDKGMKSPMLYDAEDIDRRSLRDSNTYGGTKYTAGLTDEKDGLKMDDFDLGQQEMEYDDEDPASIQIKQYNTRKDFFRIALVEDTEEKMN